MRKKKFGPFGIALIFSSNLRNRKKKWNKILVHLQMNTLHLQQKIQNGLIKWMVPTLNVYKKCKIIT